MCGDYNLVPYCDACKTRMTVLEVTFDAQGVYLLCICATCNRAPKSTYFANFNELIPLAIQYGSKFEVNGRVKN